jgi:hypothetical protein
MQLGTPPQNVTLLLDSGSALFWSECNDCPDCTGLHNVGSCSPPRVFDSSTIPILLKITRMRRQSADGPWEVHQGYPWLRMELDVGTE